MAGDLAGSVPLRAPAPDRGEVARYAPPPPLAALSWRRITPDGARYWVPTQHGDPTRQPVMRTSVNRVAALEYSLGSEPAGVRGGDFAVGAPGEVYRLAWGYERAGYWILAYDRNARVQRRIRLEPTFRALHLAVLPEGGFVVDGLRLEHQSSPLESVTVLLDREGRFVRFVELSHEMELNDAARHNDDDMRGPGTRNVAVDFTQMSTGRDGNVRLIRHSRPSVAYVISPEGQEMEAVVRGGSARTLVAEATPADFPGLGVLPAYVASVVQVQQQPFPPIEYPQAEKVVVHKGQ